MFIFENDRTQNAHLSKSKNDRVNSWYENHRDSKAYERFKHMPNYSTGTKNLHISEMVKKISIDILQLRRKI